MKALQIADDPKEKLKMVEMPMPSLSEGEVLIKLKAVALNRRDQWIREDKYPNIKPNTTLGSDGCGVVEKVQNEADNHWLGKTVIINPNIDWGTNSISQSPHYQILGMPTHGTFAEYIAVKADRLHLKPAHLTDEQAATLPLGGLTAYRAVFTFGGLQAGENVLISGVGGGVAMLAFQFALAAKANVYVTSGSKEKIEKALQAGAIGGANYKEVNWNKELHEKIKGLNLVVDSGGGKGFSDFIRMMKQAGRIVFYGATQGLPTTLDLYRMFFYQLRIQGSTMGNDQEFSQMLDFVSKQNIVPFVDSVRPFANIISAFDDMKAGNQFGKLVVSM
ncbi:MAG: alcohol dehydrogenase [Cytophagales bacterium]|nr:MAG: alcohol dehydrogenase [Cytophagales bacterium]